MLRRFPVLLLAPVLALLALTAWAFASPVGSSPDDDFHLVSIWCASPSSAEVCQTTGDPTTRIVPESLVKAPCYAFDSTKSASCQNSLSFSATPVTSTDRGNFAQGYPPIYYATMGLFAGSDIAVSVIVMRLINIVLFVGLGTALYLLLPVTRRSTLVWSWVLTTVPLGLFLLASNNPSAWAITGVGMGWIALLGYFETGGRRRIALGALFVVSATMAAGSRSDAAIYMVLAILTVGILSFQRRRSWAFSAVLPVVVAVGCIILFRFSRPVASLVQGVVGDGSGGSSTASNPLALIGYNLLEAPSLWTGIFGNEWGLGWLDTSMPAVVWVGGLACFIGAGFVAVGRISVRKLVVLVLGILALWILPVAVLVGAGETVGENMQPRYLLPLIVLFTGVLFIVPPRKAMTFTRVQIWLIVATLSVIQVVALYLNIRRYVTGIDDLGLNLNAGLEWWWPGVPAPTIVWIVGSVAYAGLIAVLLGQNLTRAPSKIGLGLYELKVS